MSVTTQYGYGTHVDVRLVSGQNGLCVFRVLYHGILGVFGSVADVRSEVVKILQKFFSGVAYVRDGGMFHVEQFCGRFGYQELT